MDYQTALAAIRSWSPDDRLRLVQTLCDELAGEAPPLTEAQQRELERRLTEDDQHPDDGVPWETIRAEARARTRPS
ncbi:MAG: addiction module protein [Planctomycetia bacterium]|nr:addiction module protein [Planctomycetia bacterium]